MRAIIFFDQHAPITAAIVGAAISGGDAVALARAFVEANQQIELTARPVGEAEGGGA